MGSFNDIYEENKDIYVSYDEFNKYTIKEILKKNETSIDKFVNYILHEDDYRLIEYKLNQRRYASKYNECKTELVNLAVKYFNNYRNTIYKRSISYQKNRFNMRFNFAKLNYCRLNSLQKDSTKMNRISIPTNAYYLLRVLEYIIEYYCKEKYYYGREVLKIPYHSIKTK